MVEPQPLITMADPLTALVDREAPPRTNFFDPAAGQSILARYANARIARSGAADLAEASDRLVQGRLQVREIEAENARLEREKLLQDREDAEYQERKAAEESRTEFLAALDEIDHEAEDFDTQVVGFMRQLPPSLTEDPAVKTVLTLKSRMADDFRQRRDAEAAKKQTFENQLSLIRERAKIGMAADVTEEDVKAATRPDGTLDEFKLGTLMGARKRATASAEFDRRQNLLQQNRLALVEAKDLSKRGKERRANVERFIIEDTAAFPSRVASLTAGGKKTIEDLELDPATANVAREAKEWDKNKLQKELSAAYAYQDPDEYVNLVPGLSDSQKARRRQVWEHAHRDDTFEETPAAPEGVVEDYVPPPKVPVRGDRVKGYIFLGGNPADKANWRKE